MSDINRPYRKAFATNTTSSSFPSKVPTIVEPVNDGVVQLALPLGGGLVPAKILVLPYGLGSDNDVFDMRVIGWRRIGSGPSPGVLWVPTLLGVFTCTLSAMVGVAGSPVLNTERFADTITIGNQQVTTADVTNAGTVLLFSGNDLIAWLEFEIAGIEKVEFTFDNTTGTAAANALVSFTE